MKVVKQFAVILSKEEKREGDIYLPIGIIDRITKNNIRKVISDYMSEYDADETLIKNIVNELFDNHHYDDWDNSDYDFRLEVTNYFE